MPIFNVMFTSMEVNLEVQEFILVLCSSVNRIPRGLSVMNCVVMCYFLGTKEKGCVINSYFHKSSFHFCFLPYDMLSSILIIPIRLISATDDDQ